MSPQKLLLQKFLNVPTKFPGIPCQPAVCPISKVHWSSGTIGGHMNFYCVCTYVTYVHTYRLVSLLSQGECGDELIREAIITLGSFAHGSLYSYWKHDTTHA